MSNKGQAKKGLRGLDARVAKKKKVMADLNARLASMGKRGHRHQRRDSKGRFA